MKPQTKLNVRVVEMGLRQAVAKLELLLSVDATIDIQTKSTLEDTKETLAAIANSLDSI